jgi:hypothetical protein
LEALKYFNTCYFPDNILELYRNLGVQNAEKWEFSDYNSIKELITRMGLKEGFINDFSIIFLYKLISY